MDNNQILCVICEEEMFDGTQTQVIGERACNTLKETSKSRGDDLHVTIRKMTRIIVHKSCYSRYTHYKQAEYARARLSNARPFTSTATVSTRTTPSFSFKIHCIICMEDASETFIAKQQRKRPHKREIVSFVQKEETLNKMRKHASELQTYKSAEMLKILSNVDISSDRPRYHRNCFIEFYTLRAAPKERINITDPIIKHISDYFEAHALECQFSLKDILSSYEGEIPENRKYLHNKIQETFGDDIVYYKPRGKDPILCYKGTGQKIVTDGWYELRSEDEKEERLRIVQTAANIISKDIRSIIYDCDNYPVPREFFNDADEYIPESLKTLVDTIMLKYKKTDLDKHQVKALALGHALISAARPTSFLSPILTAVASLIRTKPGSKDLIDLLNSLGFSAPYSESTSVEMSAVLKENKSDLSKCFSQVVFNNANRDVPNLNAEDSATGEPQLKKTKLS